MEIRRFYVNPSDIDGDTITISGEEFIHITKVLRHKVGYKIVVSNNCDNCDYYAIIRQISGDKLIAQVDSVQDNKAEPKKFTTLFIALPKGDKLDFIAQKACELGVSKIVPFKSQNVSESKCNRDRINRIILEACKQCGRAKLVELTDLIEYNDVLKMLKDYDMAIFANEHENRQSLKEIDINNQAEKVAIIVGSEGGFCQEEVEQLRKDNAISVTLGRRILRCETACIAMLSMVMYELGELQ